MFFNVDSLGVYEPLRIEQEEEFNAILRRIQSNNESLKMLKIIEDSFIDDQKQDSIQYGILKRHMNLFPGSFTTQLAANMSVTSLSIEIPYFDDDDDAIPPEEVWTWDAARKLARCVGEMKSISQLTLHSQDYLDMDENLEQKHASYLSMFVTQCRSMNTLRLCVSACTQIQQILLTDAFGIIGTWKSSNLLFLKHRMKWTYRFKILLQLAYPQCQN